MSSSVQREGINAASEIPHAYGQEAISRKKGRTSAEPEVKITNPKSYLKFIRRQEWRVRRGTYDGDAYDV